MGIRSFMDSTRRLFHVAQKPARDEVMLLIKISAIGIGVIGGIGFIVRIMFWVVWLLSKQPLPPRFGG